MSSDAHIRPKRTRANANQTVVWSKPNLGWIKLNVDGSCRDNLRLCGGGGILHDHRGSFRAAFFKKFHIGTNNRAELQVLIS